MSEPAIVSLKFFRPGKDIFWQIKQLSHCAVLGEWLHGDGLE
jgi:hypothetical protein